MTTTYVHTLDPQLRRCCPPGVRLQPRVRDLEPGDRRVGLAPQPHLQQLGVGGLRGGAEGQRGLQDQRYPGNRKLWNINNTISGL